MPHALFAQQKTRLLKRNTETEESLRRRLNIAELDMEYGMIKLFVKTSELYIEFTG
jgi:guanylate kinase